MNETKVSFDISCKINCLLNKDLLFSAYTLGEVWSQLSVQYLAAFYQFSI